MLLARPATGCDDHAGRGQTTKAKSRKAAKTLELTRLLPLKFVRISIHDRESPTAAPEARHRRPATCICAPAGLAGRPLRYWEKLIYPAAASDSQSSTYAIPAGDMICMPMFERSDRGAQRPWISKAGAIRTR